MGTYRDTVGKETDTVGTYRDIVGKETLWVHTGT